MKIQNITALVLCLLMLVAPLSLTNMTAFAEETTATVIAGSDFQPKDGGKQGIKEVEKILNSIKNDGITKADGFLFCGDYDFGTFEVPEETREGIDLITGALGDMVPKENMIFSQGNHDAMAGTNGLSYSGARDPESGKYGVFVINEDDYMWYNKDETRIKRTAQRLIDYLNGKLAQGYTKPIFVMSHLPLHYNLRTVRDGDGTYASYLFNVLNEAGKKGLNIIFLFGHDHSNGWDDYLGAGSIYLAKGDEILIADNHKEKFSTHTLQFTYMNAGYTGYYDVHNEGADGALTMTSFRIDEKGAVTITRYDNKGIHNLKAKGVRNNYKEEKAYAPNEKVYSSRQIVAPGKVVDQTPIAELMKLTGFGRQYQRINSLDELRDGGKYLLIYHGEDGDYFLCPRVVSKFNSEGTRVGFDLRPAYAFGESEAYGNYDVREWTFTMVGNKWKLSNENKYITLTPTKEYGVEATLEKDGSLFDIAGEVAFTFCSGGNYFNYNSRELINGYPEDPANFYIYEYIGYSLAVTDGTATVNGKIVNVAYDGDKVTFTAAKAPAGMYFDKWVLDKGEVIIEDPTKEEITITMPSEAIRIRATYTDKKPVSKNDNGDNTVLWIVLASAVVVVLGSVGTVLVVKNKKSKTK